jgi:hypothetical protein
VSRSVYAYALTDLGREAAFLAPMEERGAAPASAENPVKSALSSFVARQKSAGAPYAALFIRLDPTGEARAAAGAKHWNETRALYGSILREIFNDTVQVVAAGETFLVLIPDTTADRVATGLPELRQELEKHLRYPTGARYDVLSPDVIERYL